jgi:1,4-alpha-glucan branching enzyme
VSLTLHAHLPYVVNHGTWPHGIEWLHEAAAETYLPLLRVLRNLERDGLGLHCNLNLSPVLLEQLAHPLFQAEFPHYLERKITSAGEDEAYFNTTGEQQFAETARFWHRFFSEALSDFEALGRDIIRGFREFNDKGLIELITCCATHGYMPLLGTDESLRAQVRLAVDIHTRHLGKRPRGIWVPECGYRPAGQWRYPVQPADAAALPEAFDRIGVEQALSESGLEFFFVDTHLIEESARVASPYGGGAKPARGMAASQAAYRKLYQPYYVSGSNAKDAEQHLVSVFPRDPRTGLQVWSAEYGYPGDPAYLDFHKKRWPGGHRYWRVTGERVEMDNKQPYDPQAAADRVQNHASHFVHLIWEALEQGFGDAVPPVLSAPFDAELFGHWWFEGPQWLEAVARILHDYPVGIELISGSEYLDRYPRGGFIAMHEGSWGAEGTNHVWMNPETAWTYTQLYPAELYLREVCTAGKWRQSGLGIRVVQQMCRELLLLESSDWQFLITTGAARDYAELRFVTHLDQFNELKQMWQVFDETAALSEEQQARLAAIEERDSIFREIDPGIWATGARENLRGVAETARVTGAGLIDEPNDRQPAEDSTISEVPKFIPTGAP